MEVQFTKASFCTPFGSSLNFLKTPYINFFERLANNMTIDAFEIKYGSRKPISCFIWEVYAVFIAFQYFKLLSTQTESIGVGRICLAPFVFVCLFVRSITQK